MKQIIGFCLALFFALVSHAREAAQIFVPKAKGPLPVVLLLHGYVGSSRLIDAYFGYQAEVERRGFILIVPNGLSNRKGARYWNATPACCDFDHTGVDDVSYLLGLIQTVQQKYDVDRTRIFAAGHSNGGFMAHRLACEPKSPISRIVSFAGMAPETCLPSAPLSVLQIQAEDDDTIFYNGHVGYPGLAPYPSALTTVEKWAQRNGCGTPVLQANRIDLVSTIPGLDSQASVWPDCRRGVKTILLTIQSHASAFHFPHTPLLNDAFTQTTLDFLLKD